VPWHPPLVLPPPATDVAFFVVFGLFVVAMVVLVALIIVRAVRHDVIGRPRVAGAPGGRVASP